MAARDTTDTILRLSEDIAAGKVSFMHLTQSTALQAVLQVPYR